MCMYVNAYIIQVIDLTEAKRDLTMKDGRILIKSTVILAKTLQFAYQVISALTNNNCAQF